MAQVPKPYQIDVIAVTDHDMIAGYERAKVEGEKWGIQVIPGVEISTDKYHILGHKSNFEVNNPNK